MHFENIAPFLFVAFFVFMVGSFLVKMYKNGGFKGAMFGAPIVNTVGEVSGTGSKIMGITVRVHVLGGDSPDRSVGLEFVAKSVASYQMMPVSLSAIEAKKLIGLLESATKGK
jgi:hypothetical protein